MPLRKRSISIKFKYAEKHKKIMETNKIRIVLNRSQTVKLLE